MTEPVTPAQNTPQPAPEAPAPAKPAPKAPAQVPAAKSSTKTPAQAPAAKGSPKATQKAPAKAADNKAPGKTPAAKTPASKAPGKAAASKGTKAATPAKAEVKPAAPVVEPIKPGKDSWSRIATQVNGSRSVNELLKKAGISGWNVKPYPASVLVPTGACIDCERLVGELHTKDCPMLDLPDKPTRVDLEEHTSVPVPMFDSYGLVRPNPDPEFGFDVLGHTKSDKVPVPIEVRAEMLTSIMKDTKAKTGPAGPLWDGKAAFASIRLPEPVMVGGKDPVEIRVVLINSVVPGRKSQVIISPVRVATQTVFPFESMPNWPNIYELSAADDKDTRITETSDALNLLNTYTEWFKDTADKLLAQTMTAEELNKLTNELFPYSDSAPAPKRARQLLCRRAMHALFNGEFDITAAIKGTRYAALVAVLTVLEHLDPGNDGKLDPADRAMDVLFSTKTVAHTAFRILCKGLK